MRRRAAVVVASLVLATTGCADDEPTTSPTDPPATPSEVRSTPTGASSPSPVGTAAPTPTAGPTPTASPHGPSSARPTSPSTFDAAGHTFTAVDDGVHAHLAPDATTELLQSDPRAADPTVEGDSIELVEMVNITGSGRRQWELRAVAPGTSVLTVPDDPEAFTITLTVR